MPRALTSTLEMRPSHVTVLTGVRRCGKSTLQAQLMRRTDRAVYASFEDTRLFGFGPDDFSSFISVVDEIGGAGAPVFLDDVQEAPDWPRLVRALLDQGRVTCVTGSNASLLGREVGTRLTGRHLSFEVFPFSYAEYRTFTGQAPGPASFRAFLDDGGFPAFLGLGQDVVLQTLTKSLAVPTVGQTSRYVEHLLDAYLLFAVPRFSASVKQRVVAPPTYYAVDNGLRRANSVQTQPDVGHSLENAVALHLRRHTPALSYAGERGLWECDFVTPDAGIQVCLELTPANRNRELRGVVEGSRLRGRRRGLVITLDQSDRLVEDGVAIEVVPAWRWMTG